MQIDPAGCVAAGLRERFATPRTPRHSAARMSAAWSSQGTYRASFLPLQGPSDVAESRRARQCPSSAVTCTWRAPRRPVTVQSKDAFLKKQQTINSARRVYIPVRNRSSSFGPAGGLEAVAEPTCVSKGLRAASQFVGAP
jgi:hypothetical protein